MKGDKKTILAVVLIIAAIGVVAYQLLGSATSSTKGASSAIAAPVKRKIVRGDTRAESRADLPAQFVRSSG